MSDQPQLSDADREYLMVLDATGAVASMVLALPVDLIEKALTAGRSAVEEPGAATPEDIADVRKQIEFLDAFLTFRKALDQFAEAPSALERVPGDVSPGGVVLP